MAIKKINTAGLRQTKNAKNAKQSILVVGALLLVIIIVFIINIVSVKGLKETVDIVVFTVPLAQDTVITEDKMTKKTMFASEFKAEGEIGFSDGSKRSAIVRWDDRKHILNTYAAHYIRENTPVYWDALTKEITKKNSYLYKMDGELLKLDVSADVFGDMIVPGDRVNIRCIYTDTTYKLPTVEEYEAMTALGLSLDSTEEKQIMLFSNVSILDMLNANGESIFDIYYNFINLSVSEQQAMLKSEDFKTSTAPSQILLCVTAEEADMYMRIQNKTPQYMLTLLPREGSNLILDALADLQASE